MMNDGLDADGSGDMRLADTGFTVRFSQLASVSANASSLLTFFLTGYFGCVSPLARYFLIVVRDKAGPFCNLSNRQMLTGVPATNYT